MAFIILVALIALSIAATSEFFAVAGLAMIFPSIFWSVIIMGVVLGAGKLAGASFVYRYHNHLSKALIIPIGFFVFVLTIITMTGHFGYLSNGYLKDSIGTKQLTVQIATLEEEHSRKIDRKKEIDLQIAQLPTNYSRSRINLAKSFEQEQSSITSRVNELDTQLTELKLKQIDVESHTGPIVYIAKAVGLSTDDSIKWLILLIVVVFDPLAVLLIVSVSAMLLHREQSKLLATVCINETISEIIPDSVTEVVAPDVVEEPKVKKVKKVKPSTVVEKRKWFEPESKEDVVEYTVINPHKP